MVLKTCHNGFMKLAWEMIHFTKRNSLGLTFLKNKINAVSIIASLNAYENNNDDDRCW